MSPATHLRRVGSYAPHGLVLVAVAALGLSAMAGAEATGEGVRTVRIEVRVWQSLEDGREIHLSARPADGSWRTLGTIPLPLDDGFSDSGHYRYGDTSLGVPVPTQAIPPTVEVRVWQQVRNPGSIYISARPRGGSWQDLGTIRLPLDAGRSTSGRFRYGDIALDVPLPNRGVATLAGGFGTTGYPDKRGWGEFGLAVASDGSVIVADRWNHAIRRVTPEGVVTTIAGGNGAGLLGGAAENAQFDSPRDVAIDGEGAIYVADTGNHRIRKITADGVVSTIAGSDRGEAGWREIRDGPAEEALLAGPTALVLDPYGDLYILERFAVRRLSPSGWVSTVLKDKGWGWRDGPTEEAELQSLYDMAADDAGNLYLIDDTRGSLGSGGMVLAIRRIDTAGIVTTLYRDRPPSLGGTLAYPSGLAVTGDGTVYLANTGRHQIVRLTADGELQAVAGTGQEGQLEGPHRAATFSAPSRMAFAPDGSLVVADQDGTVIRRVLPGAGGSGADAIPLADFEPLPRVAGVRVSVLAGEGEQGFLDGQGTEAQFFFPVGMGLDGSKNVIVADSGNDAIRAIGPDGTVTTLAGGNGEGARDGPCEDAQFSEPAWVAVDAGRGFVYVSERRGHRIRRIDVGDPGSCSVTTVAGSGEGGFRDGSAAGARFSYPQGLVRADDGSLFVADSGNNLIRRVFPGARVSTIAGDPGGFRGNPGTRDGTGPLALFSSPEGIALDREGNILFTESNNAIRKIDRDGFVSTVLRTPGYDEGGALSPFTSGIAVGPDGSLYVADFAFARVLRLTTDGILSIVADGETPMPPGYRFGDPYGLLATADGTLFVTARHTGVVFKITFED